MRIADCVLLLAAIGCGEPARPPDSFPRTAEERIETAEHGPVRATLTVSPPAVDLAYDNLLSLTLEAPAAVRVELPLLADRLTGFTISGLFDETSETDAERRHAMHAKLTPIAAAEYRIAPLVIRYTTADGEARWFHTPPVTLPPPGTGDAAAADPGSGLTLQPLYIPPAPATIMMVAMGSLALLAMLVVTIRNLPRLRRAVRAVRQSPGQRALRELDALLAAELVEAGRIKDFYRELTRIVRHYIEREHHIRAPAQTTPEFLAAAIRDPRFPPDTVARLRAFLESADLVKFAGRDATPDEIATALATARALVTG